MNLIETLLGSAGEGVVKQLAGQFGVNADQATSVLSTLAPALAGGLKEKIDAGGGAGLMDLISGGSLTKFANDPTQLATPSAVETGKSLLTQLFGGGDLSSLVSGVSQKSGVDGSIIQTMLPVLATLVMGFLSKKTAGGSPDDLTNLLGTLTGSGDGILGAVKGMAAKIFGS